MDRITFVLNGTPVRPDEARPASTLLDWLRDQGLTGTKEGCAEGDCGACTVALTRPRADGGQEVVPVNACLTLLAVLDGASVTTVEGLRAPDGAPHPLQLAFALSGATQCGFCTPGLVMAAHAHLAAGGRAEHEAIHDAIAGNLCRCTGYRPIVEAIERVASEPASVPALAPVSRPATDRVFGPLDGQTVLAPASLASLLELRARHPEAWLMAGGTDLGLRVSVARERPPLLVLTGFVPELQAIERQGGVLRLGAAVSYVRALPWLTGGLAPFASLLRWLGSAQIRSLGTLGGNLGTASPIGDSLPALVALGARVTLASAARGARVLAVEEFLAGYRRTLLAPDEVIVSVDLPEPPEGTRFHAEKVSKRRDQDIATVGAAFLVELEGGVVTRSRLAWGAMADRVRRAPRVEAALAGRPWTPDGVEPAARLVAGEFEPWSDIRGSAGYRLDLAANLLRRAVLRDQGAAASLDQLAPLDA